MQEVEFSQWEKQDACSKINRFLNQIVDASKFHFDVVSSMLEFDLSGKFDTVANITINKGHQAMLVEVAVPLVSTVEIFNVHVATHDGFRTGNERPSIDQLSGSLHG